MENLLEDFMRTGKLAQDEKELDLLLGLLEERYSLASKITEGGQIGDIEAIAKCIEDEVNITRRLEAEMDKLKEAMEIQARRLSVSKAYVTNPIPRDSVFTDRSL